VTRARLTRGEVISFPCFIYTTDVGFGNCGDVPAGILYWSSHFWDWQSKVSARVIMEKEGQLLILLWRVR
jgi:hypothetical protein